MKEKKHLLVYCTSTKFGIVEKKMEEARNANISRGFLPPGTERFKTTSSLKPAQAAANLSKLSSSKRPSRGTKTHEFPLQETCDKFQLNWFSVKLGPFLSFLGPHSLKSSAVPSVKTSKIVAVAQSKLTFIKPKQNGISRKKNNIMCCNFFLKLCFS